MIRTSSRLSPCVSGTEITNARQAQAFDLLNAFDDRCGTVSTEEAAGNWQQQSRQRHFAVSSRKLKIEIERSAEGRDAATAIEA
jgi:hypothetical protein